MFYIIFTKYMYISYNVKMSYLLTLRTYFWTELNL